MRMRCAPAWARLAWCSSNPNPNPNPSPNPNQVRACVGAGSVVLFSSRLWHSSAANTSAHDRRAFYAQYSRAPLGGAAPLSLAVRTAPR